LGRFGFFLSINLKKGRDFMKRLIIIITLSMLTITGSIISFSTPVAATETDSTPVAATETDSIPVVATETDIYLKIENFTWKEFDDSGTQLLEESGPIFGLGFSVKSDYTTSALFVKGKGEIFGGSVDYDGQTQAGSPVKTDTDYIGFKGEGDLGLKYVVAEKSSLEPFVGLGFRWWLRDIKSTSTVIGYEETWRSFYARLGVRGNMVFSDKMEAFAEGGLKLPIYTENEIDFFNVTLEPGNEASAFAEIGLKWTKFKASLFYEGMRFSKSDLVVSGAFIYWQPESKADIYGLSVGWVF
jgi:hypothetical protein